MGFLSVEEQPESRIFVLGSLEGDYYCLINFLFDQCFSHKDILILTGNFINIQDDNSNKLLEFLSVNTNCFSVQGTNERDYIENINEYRLRSDIHINPAYFEFIRNLPIAIEIPNKAFITYDNNQLQVINKENIDGTKEFKPIYIYSTNQDEQSSQLEYKLGSIKTKLQSLIIFKNEDPIIVDA